MKKIPHVLPLLFCMAMIQSCNPNDTLLSTDKILVTSESTIILALVLLHFITGCNIDRSNFDFNEINDRVWIGEDFWSVPLEDWKIENGRIEFIGSYTNSRVNVLTSRMNGAGNMYLSFRFGIMENGTIPGRTGVRLAMTDQTDNDYKSLCYHGKGIDVGVNTSGELFISQDTVALPSGFDYGDMTMIIQANADESNKGLNATITDANGITSTISTTNIDQLEGMIAFVNNFDRRMMNNADVPKFWFDDIQMSGSMLKDTPDHAFGPILFSMYTLSKGTLKMMAQLPPLGMDDNKTVVLQVRENGEWKQIAASEIDEKSYVAAFKIEDWTDTIDHSYRLAYTENYKNGTSHTTYREGVVRKDPVDQPLAVAGFTCQFDYGFPYTPLVTNVDALNPDLLYFSGDQIYEANGGYGIIRFPADRAILNYLGKWYMFGWAFGDLMKDRPTITIPDDHEVFQGNLWGAGGKTVSREEWGKNTDCTAGFVQPLEMVEVVMQTNCSQLPDPVDPTPMDNGIAVYYTDLLYGNVSFAIVGDRIFKSGVENVSWWDGRRDHIKFPVKAEKLDKPGLKLLGDRQLDFLNSWAEDWKNAEFKCLLSQTIFANASTHHGGERMFLYGDMDSGGWPKSGRDKAVKVMRKAAAFHICGDQHLPSFAQYGIDDYRQGPWVFCTPAITVGYQRGFFPEKVNIPIKNKPNHQLQNTGEFTDVFGNPHYVYAIGNPEERTNYPNRYRQAVSRSSGFGMSIFDPQTGNIRNEAYLFDADLDKPLEENMFPGWPVTINKLDNLGDDANIELPTIRAKGDQHPVVKVYDSTGALVFAVRTNGGDFTPEVRQPGEFTIVVGYPENDHWKKVEVSDKSSETIEIGYAKD